MDPSSSSIQANYNIVRLCGSSKSSCGYCRGQRAFLIGRSEQDCSKAYGLLVSRISAKDYETLIYHGWRRSGLHLYKPDNFNSCCPALTIRLPVSEFKPTKSQRKGVWNRMQHALARQLQQQQSYNGSKKRARVMNGHQTTTTSSSSSRGAIVLDSEILQELERHTRHCMHALVTEPLLKRQLDDIPVKFKIHRKQQHCVVLATTFCAAIAGVSKGQLDRTKLSRDLTNRLKSLYHIDHDQDTEAASSSAASVVDITAHGASGQVLITVSEASLSAPSCCSHDDDVSMSMDTTTNTAADDDKIGQWLQTRHDDIDGSATVSPHGPYSLEIKMVPALESALQPDVHQLYFLHQHKVHGDPDVLSTLRGLKSNNSNIPDDITAEEDWGEATEDWIVRAKSMLTDCYGPEPPIAEFISFYKFLVESPLVSSELRNNHRLPHGTYHQQYRIENKLIAVGVVDVLPSGLSSVYAFYDPDFSHNICALGKYTSLYEIKFVQELGLPYYYMGYYIESCRKMTYKADYRPSQLLCPTHYVWVDAEEAKETLRKHSPERHCCTLYLAGGTEAKKPSPAELNDILQRVPLNVGAESLVTFDMLNQRGQEIIRPLLEEFVEQVGTEVSPRCVVVLV